MVGKVSFASVKEPKRANSDEVYQFYGFVKSRKHSLIFVIDSYLKDSAFTPVNMRSSKQGM